MSSTQQGARTCLVAGASGLVGSELLRLLLEAPEYRQVTALVRRPLSLQHPRLRQATVDFDHLDAHADLFRVDDLYCCLGTTRKKAGSQEAFRRVDLDYPVALAGLARECGVAQYLIITSMGADPRSLVFYSRVKGQVEQAISGMGLPAVHIFRPSLLLGQRTEHRLGEEAAARVSRWIPFHRLGPLRRYQPIAGSVVARAMYRVASAGAEGVHIYPSVEIARLGSAQLGTRGRERR